MIDDPREKGTSEGPGAGWFIPGRGYMDPTSDQEERMEIPSRQEENKPERLEANPLEESAGLPAMTRSNRSRIQKLSAEPMQKEPVCQSCEKEEPVWQELKKEPEQQEQEAPNDSWNGAENEQESLRITQPETDKTQRDYSAVAVKQNRKKEKQTVITMLIACAAFVVLMLGWCVTFHITGKQALKAGNLDKAIFCFQSDPLFSRAQLWNARSAKVDELTAQKEYHAAAQILSDMGPQAHERWQEAVIAEAWHRREKQNAEAGITYLEQYAEDAAIVREISRLTLENAREYLEAGQYEQAMGVAGTITKSDAVDLDAFYAEAYYLMGMEALSEGNNTQASEYLMKSSDPAGKELGGILLDIEEGRYYEAAERVVKFDSSSLEKYLPQPLSDMLQTSIQDNLESEDLEKRFRQEIAKAMLDGDRYPTEVNDLSFMLLDCTSSDWVDVISNDEFIGEIWHSSSIIPLDSLDSILQKAGTAPKGKILILRKQFDYPKGDPYYAVDMDVMAELPLDLYPKTLAEVQYLITVEYDYSINGNAILVTTYNNGTTDRTPVKLLRLKGRIFAEELPSRKEVHRTAYVHGKYGYSAYGGGSDWVCGAGPNLQKSMLTVMEKIAP